MLESRQAQGVAEGESCPYTGRHGAHAGDCPQGGADRNSGLGAGEARVVEQLVVDVGFSPLDELVVGRGRNGAAKQRCARLETGLRGYALRRGRVNIAGVVRLVWRWGFVRAVPLVRCRLRGGNRIPVGVGLRCTRKERLQVALARVAVEEGLVRAAAEPGPLGVLEAGVLRGKYILPLHHRGEPRVGVLLVGGGRARTDGVYGLDEQAPQLGVSIGASPALDGLDIARRQRVVLDRIGDRLALEVLQGSYLGRCGRVHTRRVETPAARRRRRQLQGGQVEEIRRRVRRGVGGGHTISGYERTRQNRQGRNNRERGASEPLVPAGRRPR